MAYRCQSYDAEDDTNDRITSSMRHLETSTIPLKDLGYPPRHVLWKATFDTKMPLLLFIGPPVLDCIVCKKQLLAHNPPTTVVCFGLEGPLP